MRKYILFILVICAFTSTSTAQKPSKLSSNQIYEKLQKLNFLGSALYIAAHPDDENTRLISYLSNNVKARTAYLSLTRGDGGQNLIGPEIREQLGVIRTQELLAARGIDGGQQLFTRANDFGYSKHPDETLDIWNKDEVLSDVVWAIRKFKPDVIINRFDHRTPGRTHGHHTASAMLSMEAFDLAGDKTAYASQLSDYETWQPTRLFFNTSWWFYGSRENFEKADKSKMLNFDIGVYYPLKGLSNNELASMASSQHLCQGFGRLTTRGSQEEYVEFLKGDFPEDKSNIFSGIDTSWNRLKGGKTIGTILTSIEKNFNFVNPAEHLPKLMEAYGMIQKLEDAHWKAIKLTEIELIIQACAGLYLEASAAESSGTPRANVTVNIEALNRSNANIKLTSVTSTSDKKTTSKALSLQPNTKENFELVVNLATDDYSAPYWLFEKGTLGMYKVADQHLRGLPETPRPAKIKFNLEIDGKSITITKPVVYRHSKPDKGELYQPFEILPAVTANFKDKVLIFSTKDAKEIPVTVKAGTANIDGYVSIKHPYSWKVYPAKQKVVITQKGDEVTLMFTVIPPATQSEGVLTPEVFIGDKKYTQELNEIDYDHIPKQSVLLPSETKVVRLNIQKSGQYIGYIQGAGDAIPESLQQIGYDVTIIDPSTIDAITLEKFDAVVIGIRAYNTVDELKFKQKYILEYVKNGGNVIVQYNTNRRLKVENDMLAPYKLQLSRDRVTDEFAAVEIIAKDHSIVNFPNKIEATDFEGWVQERGLYFPNDWAPEFTPILSMNDKGETPKTGSLLVAKYGKGNYIYTGLSFFRELPAGVPGAYKLFTNMISVGKTQIITQPQLKN
ncbi:Mycothiol S-conjugate amidase [Kordia antarctica]|uniref:Mycothiol S-conjugate amidase n=1 Tax=Kordia antarctica TaxID=1218801 RepID=A0A7L4ZGC8_9FLAO|nr:PIG-L family deacetylase [Kordia antarctica]QHI35702.1 Mycothiol S-conjugate amidase [Kordia antarctica]